MTSASRAEVLGFRYRAQQLDLTRAGPSSPGTPDLRDVALLDLGAQDTGPDGARWALANRGVDVTALGPDDLAAAWTFRGAPHLYRRADLPQVAAATAPWSDADAARRVYDAAGPLKAAGIGVLDALDTVAAAMRSVVVEPTVKGEVSGRVADLLDEPYLRSCRPCDAVHLYEMPFRLAALRAGLELEEGTSPPVLRRAPGLDGLPRGRDLGTGVPERLDPVRAYLRLLGPATPKDVSGYVEAPVVEVRRRWPTDAVEVDVDGRKGWLLAEDLPALRAGPVTAVRLLGPYDLFLQARDREVLLPDRTLAKVLWPVLGRPGVVLVDGEPAGTWRPRSAGGRLTVRVSFFSTAAAGRLPEVTEQAERLARHRGAALAGVTVEA